MSGENLGEKDQEFNFGPTEFTTSIRHLNGDVE